MKYYIQHIPSGTYLLKYDMHNDLCAMFTDLVNPIMFFKTAKAAGLLIKEICEHKRVWFMSNRLDNILDYRYSLGIVEEEFEVIELK